MNQFENFLIHLNQTIFIPYELDYLKSHCVLLIDKGRFLIDTLFASISILKYLSFSCNKWFIVLSISDDVQCLRILDLRKTQESLIKISPHKQVFIFSCTLATYAWEKEQILPLIFSFSQTIHLLQLLSSQSHEVYHNQLIM